MKTFISFIVISVWLILLFCTSLCFAETIIIPPEDMKDSTIAHLQSQLTDQNIIIKNWLPRLLQKTGCKVDQNQLICPDPPKEEVKKDVNKAKD